MGRELLQERPACVADVAEVVHRKRDESCGTRELRVGVLGVLGLLVVQHRLARVVRLQLLVRGCLDA